MAVPKLPNNEQRAHNRQRKVRALLLLLSTVLAAAYHLLPYFTAEYSLEQDKRRLKMEYNAELTHGKTGAEALSLLKTLVNNYESIPVEDRYILNERDPIILKRYADALTPRHLHQWHRYTPKYHIAVIGPILLAIFGYSLKTVRR